MIVPQALTGLLYLLVRWDTDLFYLINHQTQNGFFDLIMPVLSDFHLWRWPLIALALMALLWGNSQARVTVFLTLIAVVLSDQISSGLLKSLIARPRPSHILEGVRLMAGRGGRNGCPSSHAANVFAVWMVLIRQYRKLALYLTVIPLGVAYSRIYMGVHYPLDVIAGAALGSVIAYAVVNIARSVSRRFHIFRSRGTADVVNGHGEKGK